MLFEGDAMACDSNPTARQCPPDDLRVPRPEAGTIPMRSQNMDLAWGASSVVGLRRRSNQDRYLQHGFTFGVADGMGGLSGGTEASSMAVDSIVGHISSLDSGVRLTRWEAMVRSVNSDVRTRLGELGVPRAGCTLTLASVEPDRVIAIHVGDSRLYDYVSQTGVLTQRTSDHNLQNELQARGRSLRAAAREGLPLSGLISYIGMPDDDLRVDVFSWSPVPGTRLLLCSDGVHRYLGPSAISEVLTTFTAQAAATELTQRADAAGGRDNSTAVVVDLP